jgi:hypothetical protein
MKVQMTRFTAQLGRANGFQSFLQKWVPFAHSLYTHYIQYALIIHVHYTHHFNRWDPFAHSLIGKQEIQVSTLRTHHTPYTTRCTHIEDTGRPPRAAGGSGEDQTGCGGE